MTKRRTTADGSAPGEQPPVPDTATPDAAALEDALVQLAGEYVWDTLDPADPGHAPFFDWLAEEARHQQTAAERTRTAAAAEAFAGAMRARCAAKPAVPVSMLDLGPSVHPEFVETLPARVAQALDAARPQGCAPVLDLRVAAGSGRALWDEPCERWVRLPAGVVAGPHLVLTVAGDSMTPLLEPGDLILVRLGASAARGAIVVARQPDDGYVVKQVGRVEAHTIELVSRNPTYAPMTLPLDAETVLGTVVLRWTTGGAPPRDSGAAP